MVAAILVLVILLLVCALYVAAEFAAVGVRRERVRRLAESGNRFAERLFPHINDPTRLDRYVSACQVGITLSSLLLGAYGQAKLSELLTPIFASWGKIWGFAVESASTAIVLILLTGTQMVLSELVPKSLALQFPTQCALITVTPLRWSLAAYSWFITILNGTARVILRFFGQPAVAPGHIHSPEEIELMIADSKDGGLLEPDEHARLHRALRLGTRPVRQIMVSRRDVECVSIDDPIEKIIKRATDSPYSRLPVYRGLRDNIIGVLHVKDIVRAMVTEGEVGSIEKLLRPALFVPRSVTADRVLGEMRKQKKHQAIVVDEYGGFEGLVTLEDILSEFLGDMVDELKKPAPTPETLADGRVRLPGSLRLDEADSWIKKKWDGESDTVGGYVVECLDRMPEAGDRVTIDGLEVEIAEVAHHAVKWIVVTPSRADEPADDEDGPRPSTDEESPA